MCVFGVCARARACVCMSVYWAGGSGGRGGRFLLWCFGLVWVIFLPKNNLYLVRFSRFFFIASLVCGCCPVACLKVH